MYDVSLNLSVATPEIVIYHKGALSSDSMTDTCTPDTPAPARTHPTYIQTHIHIHPGAVAFQYATRASSISLTWFDTVSRPDSRTACMIK